MPKNERDLIASNDLVNAATALYMEGKISREEYAKVKKSDGVDYVGIFDALALPEPLGEIKRIASLLLHESHT
jgi:hypothetical protein